MSDDKITDSDDKIRHKEDTSSSYFLYFLFLFLFVMSIGLYAAQFSMQVKPDSAIIQSGEVTSSVDINNYSATVLYNKSSTPSRAYLVYNNTTVDSEVLSVLQDSVTFSLPRNHYKKRDISVNYKVRFEGSDHVLEELNMTVYN